MRIITTFVLRQIHGNALYSRRFKETMNKILLSALLLLPVPLWANSYATSFSSPPAPENPISESSHWLNGGTNGTNWNNCQTTAGFVHGTQTGTGPNYADSVCVLTGTWTQNQSAEAVLKVPTNCTYGGSVYCELEVHLNTTITSGSITGYEFNISVASGNLYAQIVRWNGILGSFTELNGTTAVPLGVTGTILKATNVGGNLTLYVNGTAVTTATDSTYTGGSPGLGMYLQGTTGLSGNYGFSSFAAVDSTGILANSCSAADVQSACSALTSSITSIVIPAGACNWTTQVTCNVPTGNTNLAIFGSGSLVNSGGGDNTVIVDNSSSNNPILVINTNSNSSALFRMAGITFQGGSGAVKYSGLVQVTGSSANFRVDHSHFSTATYSPAQNSAGMRVYGCTYGVIDHSIFDAPSGSVNNAVQQDNGGSCYSDSLGLGDQSWAHATGLGSANFLFLEDNTFNSGFSNDCTWAGRFVMRFNTFNATGGDETVQTHPTGGAGRIRGCRAWEVYQNNFDAVSGSYLNALFWVSSGTGVIWGNTVPSSSSGGGTGYKTFILLNSMRTNNATYPQGTPPAGWGYCGTGSGPSNWDQNLDGTGRHCMDQPGMGQGDLLTGGFTSDGSGSNNVCDVTQNPSGCSSYTGQWINEAVEPIYEWSDTVGQVPSNPPLNWIGSNAAFVNTFTANADYYTWCNASSGSGCTTFNGTVGVGSGVFASRPSTCTTGVAYWATDQGSWNTSGGGGQGVLYKCTSTNTWTLAYTPYTYPHPLDTGGGGGPTYNWTPTIVGSGSLSGTNCGSASYTSGTAIGPCTAVPGTGYSFTGWSAISGSAACSGSTNPCPAFSITTGSAATATFTVNAYTLSTATAGSGTGTITGCAGSVNYGATYTCTVTPTGGSSITSVTGCSGSGTTAYTGSMPAGACMVTATFAPPVPPTVGTPTFSPVAGTYSSTQMVTISSSTSGATLCYTTDGSTPTANGAGTCTHGTTYSTAVTVSVSLTLKAVGSKSGDTDSSVGSAAYVISSVLPPSKFSGVVVKGATIQ
jgi:hypothetical protein